MLRHGTGRDGMARRRGTSVGVIGGSARPSCAKLCACLPSLTPAYAGMFLAGDSTGGGFGAPTARRCRPLVLAAAAALDVRSVTRESVLAACTYAHAAS